MNYILPLLIVLSAVVTTWAFVQLFERFLVLVGGDEIPERTRTIRDVAIKSLKIYLAGGLAAAIAGIPFWILLACF
jgi:hypothetical protein